MTALNVPKPLRPGGTIAIVAPAGPEKNQENLHRITELIQSWGYHVFIAGSCYGSCEDYLAGESDEHRAEDLMMMFADDNIDGILCMRGGYGSNRLVDYLEDWGFDFSKYPKPFIGYSDITYLHTYLNQKHQLITYHGPMVKELLIRNRETEASFLEALSGKERSVHKKIAFYDRNQPAVTGTLTGGNLTMLCTTLGTDQEIDTDGKILFLEEVDEPLYSIDRLLMHLAHSGKLDHVKGIILGNFKMSEPEERTSCQNLLKKILGPLMIPVAYGFDSGHCQPNLTIPLGGQAALDPENGVIMFFSPS